MRALSIGIASVVAASAAASDVPGDFKITIEQVFSNAKFNQSLKTRDRFTRIGASWEYKDWRVFASHWYYPYCNWYDLDETTVSYTKGPHSIKAGRFLPPVAQANWDDQWYSGYVYIPIVEFANYDGRKLLERTSAGIQYDYTQGPWLLQTAWFGRDPNHNRLTPKKLDAMALKVQAYVDPVVLGASFVSDTATLGREEQMIGLDARWTTPQWVARGAFIAYSSTNSRSEGWFVDVYHRPKGWTDVTLLLRLEQFKRTYPTVSTMELISPGVKIRLPYQTSFFINYMAGPGMSKVFLGGGWALGLSKTFRF